jgi:hypothetical protein
MGISKPAETEFARAHPGQKPEPAMVLAADKSPLDEDLSYLQQMQPGEISITVGRRYDQTSTMENALSWSSEMSPDNVDKDLHPLLTGDLIKSLDEPEISGLDLRFIKRGAGYEISAYLRAPISAEDRRRVRALLESFRFVDAPVSNPNWAIFLARPHLPPEILAQLSGRNAMGAFAIPMITSTKKTATGYLVSFAQVEGRPGPGSVPYRPPSPDWDPFPGVEPLAAWKFFVKTSGEVVPIEEGQTAAAAVAP